MDPLFEKGKKFRLEGKIEEATQYFLELYHNNATLEFLIELGLLFQIQATRLMMDTVEHHTISLGDSEETAEIFERFSKIEHKSIQQYLLQIVIFSLSDWESEKMEGQKSNSKLFPMIPPLQNKGQAKATQFVRVPPYLIKYASSKFRESYNKLARKSKTHRIERLMKESRIATSFAHQINNPLQMISYAIHKIKRKNKGNQELIKEIEKISICSEKIHKLLKHQ